MPSSSCSITGLLTRALAGCLIDQADGLVHRCIKIEKNRRRLNHRHLVFLMNETHRCHPFRVAKPTTMGPEATATAGHGACPQRNENLSLPAGWRPKAAGPAASPVHGSDAHDGKKPDREPDYCFGCSRHSRGEAPNLCLKIRLKWARSLKPHANAMSPTCRAICAGSDRSRLHRSRRCIWT